MSDGDVVPLPLPAKLLIHPSLERVRQEETDELYSTQTGSPSTSYSSLFTPLTGESQNDEPNTPLLRRKKRRKRSLLKRSSSFGGAPIVVQTVIPQPHVLQKQSSSYLRWIVLILSCLLLFGNYYAYDNPAALNMPLKDYLGHTYDQWQYELNLLYAVYSFPNMFLPFFGGQLVDKLDPRVVLLSFSACVCIGQTLFSCGVSLKHFGIMLVGRVLFGIGGESIAVVQSSITTSWFKNKELAFALGLNLCISRFGSVVNAICSPRIERRWGSPVAVWAGTLACYLSFGCAVILAMVISGSPKPKDEIVEAPLPEPTPSAVESSFSVYKRRSLPDLERHGSNLIDVSETTPLLNNGNNESARSPPHPAKSSIFQDLKLFPYSFWLVCLICILLYGTVIPFNNIASDFLMSKWFPNDTETAGVVMRLVSDLSLTICVSYHSFSVQSIPDSMSAVLVPICGAIVDYYGHRASMLIFCALVIGFVHLSLGLTYINPVIPLLFLGISYSIYGVALWPSIATIIQHEDELAHEREQHDENAAHHPKLLGTAYGISTSALNTALTIIPLISAEIRVISGDFKYVEIFFACLAFTGACASIGLLVYDSYNGSLLELPEVHVEHVHQAQISPQAEPPEQDSNAMSHSFISERSDGVSQSEGVAESNDTVTD
ncbi:hypothetical protein HDU76_009283 [Blyttiomyces sp. JEL0837]|nr:hypothetical protein HDU76_009283 [Blyttiomyces sp. JEL0837]